MTRSLSIVLAALVALATAGNAMAQRNPGPAPADVAQRCVASMEQTRDRATDAIATTTSAAIDRIADLDASGAEDRAIVAAGRAGTNRVQGIARFANARIARTEAHCVRILRRLDADRALIERVRNAAAGFREDVGTAARRGTAAIRQAVADAIG